MNAMRFLILFCGLIAFPFVVNAQQRFAWYPIIGGTPETSLILGAGAYYTVKPADSVTRASFFNGNAMGTFRKQWLVGLSTNYFTPGEKYYLDADIGYVNFPFHFYGIGNDIDPEKKETYNSNTFRFQFIAYKSIAKKLFAGVGYKAGNVHRMDYVDGGILESLNPRGVNGHYFSGAQAALLYDSRDNQLGASRGWYIKLSHAFFDEALGSQFNYHAQSVDVRKYFTPWKNRKDVLAFQAFGQGVSGEVPFTELSFLGSSSLMRGYYSGKFRDRYYWASQAEYRYKANSWLGLVGFAGLGAVASEIDAFSASDIKPNYGVGARIAIMPSGNLTLRIDYGRGRDTGAVYVAIMEAF